MVLSIFFSTGLVFGETLTYDFSADATDAQACIFHGKAESKRRELITKYGLPKNLRWQWGVTRNEWGDTKEKFCYLSYEGKLYLSFYFQRFWEEHIADRVVTVTK